MGDDVAALDWLERNLRHLANVLPEIGRVSRLSSAEARALFPPLRAGWQAVHITGGARVDGRSMAVALTRAAVKRGDVKFTWLASRSRTGERITSYKVTMFSLEQGTVRVCHSVAAHCTYGHVARGIYIANVVAVDASGVSAAASALVLV